MRVCCDRGSISMMRCLLLLAALVLVSGCSSVRLVYSNLDRAVVWRTTDYVDLNREQRSWLRQEARVYLHWHRHEQLPAWAALLGEFEAGIGNGLEVDDFKAFESRARELIDDMTRKAMPVVVDLMAGFSDAQVSGLARALAESNEELNADYEGLPESEQRAVWRQKTRDGLDRWIGRLTPEQERMLEAVSREIEPDNREWVGFRRLWQADLIAALDDREQLDAFEERIVELMLHRERWYTERYREILAVHEVVYRQFAVDLLNSLDAGQQRRLSNRLSSLVRDFEILASSTRAPPESAGPAPRV